MTRPNVPERRSFGQSLQRAVHLLAVLLLACGCGYPAVQPVNMRLIASLRTALSARNTEWLALNDEQIEKRRAAGEMNDDEYEVFKSIVEQARQGDWKGAERATLEFQRAQRPTEEQKERVRRRGS